MNAAENFREVEKKLGLFYPALFYDLLCDFLKISNRPDFRLVFKRAHLCSELEIQQAIDEFLPEKLLPFYLEEHEGYSDYYCFDTEASENGNRVVVFSQDAVVFEWENFANFISWLEQKIGRDQGTDA